MGKTCANSLAGEQIEALIVCGQSHFHILNSYGIYCYSTKACHECAAFSNER